MSDTKDLGGYESEKVIGIIKKALQASVIIESDTVHRLLVELLEECHANIGKSCLKHSSPITAERMRTFYQTMIPIIEALKKREAINENFFDKKVSEVDKGKLF